MGLRKINREREGKNKGNLFSFGRKKHFAKLNTLRSDVGKPKRYAMQPTGKSHKIGFGIGKPHIPNGPNINFLAIPKEKLMPILIIVIITISIIAIEVYLWAQKEQATTGQLQENESQAEDSSNKTELVVNNTKILETDVDLRSIDLSKNTVDVGNTVDITANIKNTGDTKLTNLTIAFKIESVEIGRKTVESLPPEETIPVTFTWNATEMFVGDYNVVVVADPDDVFDEKIETNNKEDKGLVIEEKVIEDNSANFYERAKIGFVSHWYSDKFSVPPKSGEDYEYFDISRSSTKVYYLDIVVSGFKTTKQGEVYKIEIPDASDFGWNSDTCLKATASADTCIWNGPQYRFDLEFSGSKLEVIDFSKQKSTATTSGDELEKIKLVGLRTAVWPDAEIKTYRAYGAPQPDKLIPYEFYEVVGNQLFIYPMRWNPRSLNAEVATWYRFEITVN